MTKFHCPWVDPNRTLPPWLRLSEREMSRLPPNSRKTASYYLKLHSATPRWETRKRLSVVYRRAAELRARGFDVEVDHIVPLNHPEVCGLHTVDNLQIISRTRNAQKSNFEYEGMRNQQLCLFSNRDVEQLEINF